MFHGIFNLPDNRVPVHSEIAWKLQDDHLELAAGGEYLGAAGPPETLKILGKHKGKRDLICFKIHLTIEQYQPQMDKNMEKCC